MLTGYMIDRFEERPASAKATTVIALHCSGAGGAMWQPLRDALGDDARVLAPDLFGAINGPIWPGDRAFSLDDEVAPIIQLIDACIAPVHLVGHSYGAAIALQVALTRPDRVAGLTLFEPAAFQMLRAADGIEYAEITALARDVEVMLAQGNARSAMRRFVSYWGGAGAWEAMTHEAQTALIRWAPKATLDFRALLGQRAIAARYEDLDMPCRIISGGRSPAPVREIAAILTDLMPHVDAVSLPNMGHMAPLTHADEIAALIAAHVRTVARQAEFEMRDMPARVN